jgi:purine-cytosine permease-like protein
VSSGKTPVSRPVSGKTALNPPIIWGMADNDEVSGEDSADTPYIPTGPRRSTYTPPTGDYPPLFGRTDAPASEEHAEPAPEPIVEPASEPHADIAPVSDAGSPAETEAPAAELPDPPRRRSLQDDELVRTLSIEIQEPAHTLSAIEQLQAELQLRDKEAQEFSAWEQRMRAIGTPEALETIAEVVPEFTGVIPIIPVGQQQAEQAQQPESEATPPHAFVHPEQFPPPRAEERVEVPSEREPNLSDHIVFVPPWLAGTGSEADSAPQPAPGETTDITPDATDVAPDDADPASDDVLGPDAPVDASEPAPLDASAPHAGPAAPIVYELVDPRSTESAVAQPAPVDSEDAPAEPSAGEPAEQPAEQPSEQPAEGLAGPPAEQLAEQPTERVPDAFDTLLAGGNEPEPSSENSLPLVPPIEPSPADTSMPTPVATGERARTEEQEPGAPGEERAKARVFSIELSAEEATPVALRAGHAARMFWLWFATNSSAVSIAFGAALLGLGMSLRQAILAAFIGVAISFLPLGLGTLAGKWSGQPTIVVSRATFGVVGNIVPAILALVTRLFWGAVLLWLLAMCTARILVGASLSGALDETQLGYIVATVAVALAFVIAFFGYQLFARVQLVLSIVSGVLILGLFAITWQRIDFRSALTVGDGPWILVVTGTVLVFSFVGLVWANASGDLARYQRTSSSGASASLWASFGATLPAFLLIAYGALLAASSPDAARGLVANPVETIASMIHGWYPVPLLAVTALSLLAGVALSLYSGGFALRAIGMSLSRHLSVVVMAVVVFAATLLMILSGAGVSDVFRDFTTSLAVPIAAWAGIFGAEVMIRRKGFHEESLLRPGGIYPGVNWVNLAMLVVASVIGFGFTTAHVAWLSWQGYGLVLFGFPLGGAVATSDIGVLIALVLGLLTPLAAGISTVRQQELAVD